MERKEIKFKVGDIVVVQDTDYVGKGLVLGVHGFRYDGTPEIAVFKPMVPFGNPAAHATYYSQDKLTYLRHTDIPEIDVLAVDATAETIAEKDKAVV